ncbi:B12-binding domain-containing radical SAM protein [Chamaesiphon polymorphus]|uniref:B12-binding domain-containing radical SAM protein n=1 Tax=Chamaesiphon polymorphus CCALA 037 TaxID=2107692 RepID=A0A2T1GGY9_9CYAN|nr:B12-binding domain-containing radical SAM protein [Chamaesiphon polymorphus]PSB56950.1 B12-binding domain-containing radical SAM protein [Chamaesiphon polymorphus CCALA 037]
MNVLLLYPRFPKSFWSFEKTIELMGRKALIPPLGLITVAAILPQEWNYKLVDLNVREVTEAEWSWSEMVICSAMIVQKPDLLAQIQEAKRRGKRVAVGGPYATALPHEVTQVGADYLILDEGELTIPLFVEAINQGQMSGIFRAPNGERPDVTSTPVPRFELLEFDAYAEMSVQFSRGCPFQCEFCDIIVLYGRKPRTKAPAQLLKELDYLYELGWRRSIFMVDDNFIGNKRNVKLLLKELLPWMIEHKYPFSFATEASVDLAGDQELMDMMVKCNFGAVFLGIETPDEESLALTQKHQNTRSSLSEAVNNITKSGIRVMAGFIIGFDGEKTGAGNRIVKFVEQTDIPTAVFSMLQALPDTALWHRLTKEGRMRVEGANINQTTLMNFVPTRPLEEIACEYMDAFDELYEPSKFLDRTYRHFLTLGTATYPDKGKGRKKPFSWVVLRALLIICWRQGVVRSTRWQFWRNLWSMQQINPGGVGSYLGVCAQIEHFLEYRGIVRREIGTQLAEFLAEEARLKVAEASVEKVAVAETAA